MRQRADCSLRCWTLGSAVSLGRSLISAFFGPWRERVERALHLVVKAAFAHSAARERRGPDLSRLWLVTARFRDGEGASRTVIGRRRRAWALALFADRLAAHARLWLGDVMLSARFGDVETTVKTDRDGYFRLDLELPTPPPADRLWHRVRFGLDEPAAIDVEADVFIPGDNCNVVVISDIDDTIMHTGVANKLDDDVAAFCPRCRRKDRLPGHGPVSARAASGRKTGENANPMLYVSRAPWAIYGVLDRFFNLHGIPVGPILFLRDWGSHPAASVPETRQDPQDRSHPPNGEPL